MFVWAGFLYGMFGLDEREREDGKGSDCFLGPLVEGSGWRRLMS